MPTYQLHLSCGHIKEVQSDTVPTSKAPSCPECTPDPKYGKLQRPVVRVTVQEADGTTTELVRPDVPSSPRTPGKLARLEAIVAEAIALRGAMSTQDRATYPAPALDAYIAGLGQEAPWPDVPVTMTVAKPRKAGKAVPTDLLSGVRTVDDLIQKVEDQLGRVQSEREKVESMSRRSCLQFLTDRGVAGVSRKPVGDLRDLVRAEMGLAEAS